jgi:hypothetical protein
VARLLVNAVAFQYTVLRGAVRSWRDGDEGMTTLEVLVIAAGLIGLAIGAVLVITKTAQGKVRGVESPSSFLTT